MDFFSQLEDLNRPTVHKKPWMESVELHRAKKEDLDKIAEECIASGRYGLDLETTGLDQRAFPNASGKLETNDKIVGVCIAPNLKRSYYIPVRHRESGSESNVPPRLVMEMLRKIAASGAVAVFHNAKFDQKFLKHDPAGETGDWDDPKIWDDTLVLAYLRDPRDKRKGLKHLAKEELSREMIELEELFMQEKGKKKPDLDFSTLDPNWEPVVWYAAADALNTLELYYKLAPTILEKDAFGNSQKTIYTIEKICLTGTIWMEQCRIYIDRPKVVKLIQLGQKEWLDCILRVYQEVGEALERDVRPPWFSQMHKEFNPDVLEPNYMEVREDVMRRSAKDPRPPIQRSVPSLTDPKVRETVDFAPSYDITIPSEFGLLLRELGVKGLTATEKSGQVKTAKEELERIVEEAGDQYPWMKSVRRFREVVKSLSNVLFNLYYATAPDKSPDSRVWANFNGLKVDTGRFSTPTPREGEFFGQVNWNVQSTKAYYYDPKDPPPECVYRQREVVAARPGWTVFAIDFSGVELRIVTNLSGEPKWKVEFFRCSSCDHTFERGSLPPAFCPSCNSDKIGDLHSSTALGIFPNADPKGDPKGFKMMRQTAKIVNFLLCYGGSGNAVCRSTGCEEEEGWRIKNLFDKTYKGLLKWWRSQEEFAKKHKYVLTAYGRRYPVPDIDHEFAQFRSKAKRNAVNGPVQGTSADIMKFAMGLLYREFKKRGWLDKVLMMITIHDELVFEISDDIMGEAVPVIEHIMCVDTVKNLSWEVLLKVDTEFGPDWTVRKNLTELTYNRESEWTPDLASVFPVHYQKYLSLGGTPVEGAIPEAKLHEVGAPAPEANKPPEPLKPEVPAPEASKPSEPSAAKVPAPQERVQPAPAKKPPEMEGKAHVFRILSTRLSPALAEKVAKVVHKCQGRGTDDVCIRDEHGNDLLGGAVKVAWEEFRVVANYEGI